MSSAYSLPFIFFGYSYLSLLRLQIIVHTGKCIPITIGPGIYQEHMNEALDVLSNGGCVWVIFYILTTYQVKTGPHVQTWKLLIWALRCWFKGAHERVGGGICKIVIRSGRLSAKLTNPPASFGSTSCGLGSKFPSLHRWSGFHLIHLHTIFLSSIYAVSKLFYHDIFKQLHTFPQGKNSPRRSAN
jgi:hypothetical protein